MKTEQLPSVHWDRPSNGAIQSFKQTDGFLESTFIRKMENKVPYTEALYH